MKEFWEKIVQKILKKESNIALILDFKKVFDVSAAYLNAIKINSYDNPVFVSIILCGMVSISWKY